MHVGFEPIIIRDATNECWASFYNFAIGRFQQELRSGALDRRIYRAPLTSRTASTWLFTLTCLFALQSRNSLDNQAAGTKIWSSARMGTSTLGDRIFQELLGRLINQTRLSSVKRVAVLSASEFKEEYAAKSQPVIFEGIIPAGLTDEQEALRITRVSDGIEMIKSRDMVHTQTRQSTWGGE